MDRNRNEFCKKISIMKKRKLNSKNPKYNKELSKDNKEVLKKELFCTIHKGNNSKIPVYGVWYK